MRVERDSKFPTEIGEPIGLQAGKDPPRSHDGAEGGAMEHLSDSFELRAQKAVVEGRAMSGKDSLSDELAKVVGDFGKLWSVGDHFIGDPGKRDDRFRNSPARVHE